MSLSSPQGIEGSSAREIATTQDLLIFMDPPRHTDMRRTLSRAFTPRAVKLLQEEIERRSRAIVGAVAKRGAVDFVRDIAAEPPLQVIAEIMGVPQDDREQIFLWTNASFGSEDPEVRAESAERGAALGGLVRYALGLADRRRQHPDNDIASVLVSAEIGLTDMEFVMFFVLLTQAGNETTRTLLSQGLLQLVAHPEAIEELREEPDRMKNAVEEMLRIESPVLGMCRTATNDVELHGQTVRQGDTLTMWFVSGNRDESTFEDPAVFDIHRHNAAQHQSFGGGGPHFRLGAALARMEAQAVVGEIVEQLDDVHIRGPVQRLRSNFVNGIKRIPLSCAPRRHAIHEPWSAE